MNPQEVFCLNPDCHAKGQQGKGNIGIHSKEVKRYICHECKQTFSESKGGFFYRLQTDPKTVVLILTLLSYGCPQQAIVKGFGFDERTIKRWWKKAGEHCRAVHEAKVEQSQMELGQVQADEIKVKVQGGFLWMALCMCIPTRLWLGGAVSPKRDKSLIKKLIGKLPRMALAGPLLLAADGFSAYATVFRTTFRVPLHTGELGRPRLLPRPELAIVQVVKRRTAPLWEIRRLILQGTESLVTSLLERTQGGGVINTAFIERLNATFRQRLAPLARRTRSLARQEQTITAGMYILGCFYNFCDTHQSLLLRSSDSPALQRTPAMASGLTESVWTPLQLFSLKIPPAPWTPPKRRRRPSARTRQLIEKWSL